MTGLRGWLLVFAVLGLSLAVESRAQLGLDADDALIELPPLMVEGQRNLPPWLYANYDGVEYLSRCSSATTRGYIERRAAQLRVLRWLIPPEFLPRMDVPSVTVLYSQRFKAGDQEHMVRELMELRRRRGGSLLRNSRVGSTPNLMLDDRDFFAVFAYIDEASFRPEGLSVATDFVDFLLERRVPALPEWLRVGIVGIYGEMKFDRRVIIDPLTWLSSMESRALGANPHWPRTLVFAHDFFSPEIWALEPEGSPRGRTLRAQGKLFVRWALDPANGVRDAFWRFAAAAVERPVTDEMFEEYFGFGFSDWRDQLSDYLPKAVNESLVLTPPRLQAPSRLRLREATPAEVARLKGEWERLSIGFVRRRHPEFADRYIEQARGTLSKAVQSGDRLPELHATLGLCEIDAGNPGAARPHLEQAMAQKVIRPRVYLEVARLRSQEIESRREGAEAPWSDAEVAAVVEPLRIALGQNPPMPDVYRLFAQTWTRGITVPDEAGWAQLEAGLKYFPDDLSFAYDVAEAFGRHGRTERAVAVLGGVFGRVRDRAMRQKYSELYERLTKPGGR